MKAFDPIELVELGYQQRPSCSIWAHEMIGPLTTPLNRDGLEVYGFFLQQGVPSGHLGLSSGGTPLDSQVVAQKHKSVLSPLSAEQERDMWLPFSAPGVLSTRDPEMQSYFPPEVQRAVFEESASMMPGVATLEGSYAVSLPIGPGNVLALIVNFLRCPIRDRNIRALWRMLCTHLSAGLRLSERPAGAEGEDVECVLDGSGRVHHASGPASEAEARSLLSEATRRVDQARTKVGRADPFEALSLWSGLFGGRWSLVDHVDTDGRRFVLARRNEPDFWPTAPSSKMSKRQAQVLFAAAAGLTNKEIGYLFGMTSSTVATHLRRGLEFMGLTSRNEWLRMSGKVEALFRGEAPDPPPRERLTAAEREIANMILEGATTEGIAAVRATSVSTVSNQITAILSKLGLANRQALVQYLARQ